MPARVRRTHTSSLSAPGAVRTAVSKVAAEQLRQLAEELADTVHRRVVAQAVQPSDVAASGLDPRNLLTAEEYNQHVVVKRVEDDEHDISYRVGLRNGRHSLSGQSILDLVRLQEYGSSVLQMAPRPVWNQVGAQLPTKVRQHFDRLAQLLKNLQ